MKYLLRHGMVEPGDTIVVGVSGGPDSMALLHFLWNHKDLLKIEVIAAHVNHQLRELDGDQDEEFVADYCRGRQIPYRSIRVDVQSWAKEHGVSVEEAGREIRYKFYRSLLEDHRPGKIATGHHRDDQVETILMRILRGTGLRGLRGMEPVRPDGIIRPFLAFSKEEILSYCREKEIPYRVDATNFEDLYHRNRIRLQLLPFLNQFNPAVDQALLRLAEQATETENFLQKYIEDAWVRAWNGEGLNVEILEVEDPLIAKRLLMRLVEETWGPFPLELKHLNIVLGQLKETQRTTWVLNLPDGLRLRRRYQVLVVEPLQTPPRFEPFCYPIGPDRVYGFSRLGWIVKTQWIEGGVFSKKSENIHEILIDYDKMEKIGGSLVLRQRRAGDRFLGEDGSPGKKVKKRLIDRKIPVEKRDVLGCFALDPGILWIPGVEKSPSVFPDERTRRSIRIVVERIQEDQHD